MRGHTVDLLAIASRACTTCRIATKRRGRLVTFVARDLQHDGSAESGEGGGATMSAALVAVVPPCRDSFPGSQLGHEQVRDDDDAATRTAVPVGCADADSCQQPGVQQTGPPVTAPLACGCIGSRRTPSRASVKTRRSMSDSRFNLARRASLS